MYADSRTYIIIEIALEKPLVPKSPPEELAQRYSTVTVRRYKYEKKQKKPKKVRNSQKRDKMVQSVF